VVLLVATLLVSGCPEKEETDSPLDPVEPSDTSGCPQYDSLAGCGNSCSGFTPINDLGSLFFRGFQGGLYPGGINTRPVSHNDAGIALANEIVPLDANGGPDPVSGRVVMLSIGYSNSREIFERFQLLFAGMEDRNPFLDLVNGAQGGQDVKKLLSDTAAYWSVVEDTLALRGLTPLQVQIIWFKQADAGPTDSSFPGYPDSLEGRFRSAMNIIMAKYPNSKLCYFSSRSYGNYMSTDLNREPWAYYTGWAVKWMIEDQINGDPALSYALPDRKAPWFSWGVYIWADGARPRSDGLTWNCPDDYKPDLTHYSDIGRQKAAEILMDFFTTDETTVPWFLE
jgi:hypothetical protein